MAVTKEQYSDWKNHPVTQELMADLTEECEGWVGQMIRRAEPNTAEDQFIRAFVKVTDNVRLYEPKIVSSDEFKEVVDVED